MPINKLQKINSYVGYSIKSGNILYGVENILGKKKPYVVLYDPKLSSNSKTKLCNYLEKADIKFFCVELKKIFNNKNCFAIGITEKNLATAIIKEMEDSGIYE